MGKTGAARGLPDAAGGRAARRLPARLRLTNFIVDRAGSVAIEYALIAIFLGVSIIAALLTIGPEVLAKIQSPVDGLK